MREANYLKAVSVPWQPLGGRAVSEKRSSTSNEGEIGAAGRPESKGTLSAREREVVDLLAEGLSGAQIAERLVLSPETVRTHVRNAMNKLGASTRSQAVAIALGQRQREHQAESVGRDHAPPRRGRRSNGSSNEVASDPGLKEAMTSVVEGLVSLWDVEGGAIYLVDEDGLSLRRVAQASYSDPFRVPETIPLGDGPLGRAALDRRAQLVASSHGDNGTTIAAPMLEDSRLIGVVGLIARPSRPAGQRELLLLQAFAGRLAEIVRAGGAHAPERARKALEGFRTSWASATRGY
jgi:DNA-binding CsgD family transcriptional regulator